ncbi:hypothetical protein BGZ83_004433, partial [Gryganskiella cystojenkinii]
MLSPKYLIEKVDLTDAAVPPVDLSGYREVSHDDFRILDRGDTEARNLLAGAVLVTEKLWMELTCTEVYMRDCVADFNAASPAKRSSSEPTPSCQYPGLLKIVNLMDRFGWPTLEIGLTACDYLVTSGKLNGRYVVGPSHCGDFVVTKETGLYLKDNQGADLLNNGFLALSQVRSGWGHRATYLPRRGAQKGYASVSRMPTTVFSLSQWGVNAADIFYRLWRSATESSDGVPTLRLDDFPLAIPSTKPEKIVQKLRLL